MKFYMPSVDIFKEIKINIRKEVNYKILTFKMKLNLKMFIFGFKRNQMSRKY